MLELIAEYEQTLKTTRKQIQKIQREYEPLKAIFENTFFPKHIRLIARKYADPLKQEKKILSEMESDVLFSLEWLRSGRCPGNRRGIERRAAYQREMLFSPQYMDEVYWVNAQKEKETDRMKEEQLKVVEHALSHLTKKEQEVYKMYYIGNQSQYKIAEKLQLTRSSVQTMLHRADKKMEQFVLNFTLEGERDGVCPANTGH